MAKLRPIKDEAELAKVPLDEPVLVELEPETALSTETPAKDDEPPLRSGSDDGAGQLAEQLREAQDAAKRDREAREAAEREAREAREEAERLRTSSADTEKELLTSSLEKAQQERDVAKSEYIKAYELGDPQAMADAQEKIARAATDIRNFEGAIAEFDESKKAPKQADRPADLRASIDQDPQLLPDERAWLKDHIEVMQDPRLNRKLGVAYDEAMAKGFKRGSKGYFKFLDEFMGFQPDREDDDSGSDERSTIVAAPVSRESRGNSGRPSVPTRIPLTPEERQMARDMGISDAAYARGVQKREAERRSNPEKFAGR